MIVCMDLDEFLLTGDQKKLADAVGTIPAYIYQIATRRRKPSPQLAKRIHEATCGAVSLHSLRPDVWAEEKHSE